MSAPTSTAPRSGTLLTTRAVNGDATIYFAGTDGELHGFSTGHQLFSDGYDPALVVTVPSLGSLRVGSTAGEEGSAASALATRADGAIVDFFRHFLRLRRWEGLRHLVACWPSKGAKGRQGQGAHGLGGVRPDECRYRQRGTAERPGQGVRELFGSAVPVQDDGPTRP